MRCADFCDLFSPLRRDFLYYQLHWDAIRTMEQAGTYCADNGLKKVGDETSMVPDFPTGLLNMYKRIPKTKGVAYYTVTCFRSRSSTHFLLPKYIRA